MRRSALDRLAPFAAFGGIEVGCCDGGRVAVFDPADGRYRQAAANRVLPGLTAKTVAWFLIDGRTAPSPEWSRARSRWATEGRS